MPLHALFLLLAELVWQALKLEVARVAVVVCGFCMSPYIATLATSAATANASCQVEAVPPYRSCLAATWEPAGNEKGQLTAAPEPQYLSEALLQLMRRSCSEHFYQVARRFCVPSSRLISCSKVAVRAACIRSSCAHCIRPEGPVGLAFRPRELTHAYFKIASLH